MNKKELIKTLNNIYSNENDYKFADGLVNVHSMARIFIELAQQLDEPSEAMECDVEKGHCKCGCYGYIGDSCQNCGAKIKGGRSELQ